MSSGSDDLGLWDAAAPTYVEQAGADNSFYLRFADFLWSRLDPVAGLDILDLGCGHGWLTDEIRRAGARVVGVDGSAALLAEARRRYPDLGFERHDLTAGLPRPLQRYDRVVAHMVLMDIPTLDPLIADVAEALRPGGSLIFSILHPAFFARAIVDDGAERYRKVTDYLTHETRWIDTFGGHRHYHRPLSWYADLLCRHGLAITGLHEPPSLSTADVAEDERTDYQKWFNTVPTMLAMSARK